MSLEIIDDINLIQSVPQKGCLVVGDIILDKYIYGDVLRVSPEAPIPVLAAKSDRYVLGGAANVAGNIRGYKVKTFLAGALGADENANVVKSALTKKDIDYIGLNSSDRRTTIKSRVIAMNQQLVRIDEEDTFEISKDDADRLIDNILDIVDHISVVVLSDYNKGICTRYFCKKLISICKENKIQIIVDPKTLDWTKYEGVSLITPNFKEFTEMIGKTIENKENAISDEAQEIIDRYNLNRILVTRSQYGMTLVRKGDSPISFSAVQQEVFDVSGAGDTVIGTIAALLAKGMSYESAVEISNYAAGLSVSKSGTYTVSVDEVIDYISNNGTIFQTKIIGLENLNYILQKWRKQKEEIVFTNGCFDILHIGHIEYLNEARNYGTKLIVGLNSDASVKRLKGETRPINNQKSRAGMLAALKCVDAVVIFDEDTPEQLIEKVRPNFLIKGGDYKIDEIIGREYADNVLTIPLTEGYSTTDLINKIKKN